jgi:hypothetical protein
MTLDPQGNIYVAQFVPQVEFVPTETEASTDGWW